MEIKRTLTLSALLHVILFSAALLLFKGGRNMQGEDMFFVNLAEDIKRSDIEEVAHKIEKTSPLPPLKNEENKPLAEVQKKPALFKPTETTVTNDPGTEPETLQDLSSSEKLSVDATNSGGKEIRPATAALAINNGSKYREEVDTNLLERTGGEEDRGARFKGIIELIADAIERTKAYPLSARKRGIEGTVYVSFRIGADGKPEELVIQKSSGFGILDSATLDVVKKAAPYPYTENRVEIPVTYRLQD